MEGYSKKMVRGAGLEMLLICRINTGFAEFGVTIYPYLFPLSVGSIPAW
jgi:hypothetical protein